MKEWDFTITEYSVYYGISHTTATERLNALVMAGMAKKLFKDEDTGTSRRVFRVKLQGITPSDPFKLVERKMEPMPPNEWMKGAFISGNAKKIKPESKRVWGQRWRTTNDRRKINED